MAMMSALITSNPLSTNSPHHQQPHQHHHSNRSYYSNPDSYSFTALAAELLQLANINNNNNPIRTVTPTKSTATATTTTTTPITQDKAKSRPLSIAASISPATVSIITPPPAQPIQVHRQHSHSHHPAHHYNIDPLRLLHSAAQQQYEQKHQKPNSAVKTPIKQSNLSQSRSINRSSNNTANTNNSLISPNKFTAPTIELDQYNDSDNNSIEYNNKSINNTTNNNISTDSNELPIVELIDLSGSKPIIRKSIINQNNTTTNNNNTSTSTHYRDNLSINSGINSDSVEFDLPTVLSISQSVESTVHQFNNQINSILKSTTIPIQQQSIIDSRRADLDDFRTAIIQLQVADQQQIKQRLTEFQQSEESIENQHQQKLAEFIRAENIRIKAAAEEKRLKLEAEEQKRKLAEETAKQQAAAIAAAVEAKKQADASAAAAAVAAVEQEKKTEAANKAAVAESKSAAAAAALAQSNAPTPAIIDMQQRLTELRALRTVSKTFAGARKLPLTIQINRTITQISHTILSIKEKSAILNQRLTEAKSTSQQEYAYCLDLICTKLAAQSEIRIQTQSSSAYSFASVAISISLLQSAAESQFYSLFLATLAEKCIYITPQYLSRVYFKSQREYMLALGFVESTVDQEPNQSTAVLPGGQHGASPGMDWENEEQYFNRMAGYIALFAAFIQIPIPNHPYGIDRGWIWLARICNLEPRTATAAILLSFLQIAAYSIYQTYPKQFIKLLILIHSELIPKITILAKTTPRRAALTRLQLWIDNTVKSIKTRGSIEEPEGRRIPQSQDSSTAVIAVTSADYKEE